MAKNLKSMKIDNVSPADTAIVIDALAEAMNLPASALVAALEKSKQKKAYYSMVEAADRWRCSRASVYRLLEETELPVLNIPSGTGTKRRSSIPASVMEHIEKSRLMFPGSRVLPSHRALARRLKQEEQPVAALGGAPREEPDLGSTSTSTVRNSTPRPVPTSHQTTVGPISGVPKVRTLDRRFQM